MAPCCWRAALSRALATDHFAVDPLEPRVMETPSFMFREIGETGGAIARMRRANADALRDFAARARALDPKVVVTIARGSSDHCALYLKYLVEIALGIPCASIGPSIASLYDAPLRLEGALAISWSQSGRSPRRRRDAARGQARGRVDAGVRQRRDFAARRRARSVAAHACRPGALGRRHQDHDRRLGRRRGPGRRLGGRRGDGAGARRSAGDARRPGGGAPAPAWSISSRRPSRLLCSAAAPPSRSRPRPR